MRAMILPILIACLIFIATPVSAEIWTVDNTGSSDLFFTTLQAVHNDNAVEDGDTIYVHGSADSYAGFTATKRLTWIGTGYFLNQNPNTHARKVHSRVSNIYFNAGSEGSVFMGFNYTTVSIRADNIIIARNWAQHSGSTTILGHNSEVSNTLITQNYIVCTSQYNYTYAISVGSHYNNVTIENNIIINTSNAQGITVSNSANNITIANNTISVNSPGQNYALNIYNSSLHSNIINGRIQGNNYSAYNNVTSGGELSEEDDNIIDVNMADVFIAEGTTDGRWHLTEESPALEAGFNDFDCGAYGGQNPYVLSGIPPIPTITLFLAPGTSSGAQGLPIKVKIKSRN